MMGAPPPPLGGFAMSAAVANKLPFGIKEKKTYTQDKDVQTKRLNWNKVRCGRFLPLNINFKLVFMSFSGLVE